MPPGRALPVPCLAGCLLLAGPLIAIGPAAADIICEPEAEHAASLTPSRAMFLDSVEVPLQAFAGSSSLSILYARSTARPARPGGSAGVLGSIQWWLRGCLPW